MTDPSYYPILMGTGSRYTTHEVIEDTLLIDVDTYGRVLGIERLDGPVTIEDLARVFRHQGAVTWEL